MAEAMSAPPPPTEMEMLNEHTEVCHNCTTIDCLQFVWCKGEVVTVSNGKNIPRPSGRSCHPIGWTEVKFDVVDEENQTEESMTCSVELRDHKWNPKKACEGGWRLPRDKTERRNKE